LSLSNVERESERGYAFNYPTNYYPQDHYLQPLQHHWSQIWLTYWSSNHQTTSRQRSVRPPI